MKCFKGILNDKQIEELCNKDNEKPMIVPFCEKMVSSSIVSYGVGSFGYDIRLAPIFHVFKKPSLLDNILTYLDFKKKVIIDPKTISNEDKMKLCYEIEADEVIIPPHGFVLGHTVEKFDMPRNILGIAVGKSTLARCGVQVLVTPLEPGWRGDLVIEIFNSTHFPVRIKANEGICQLIFLGGNIPNTTYDDRNGKYQDQVGITHAKIKED
jgi:dCTP deaminase